MTLGGPATSPAARVSYLPPMWHRSHHSWESTALLGRHMDLLVLGHAGERALVFPTSKGSFHEWDDRTMGDAVAERLERGALQLCCISSVDDASWYNEGIPPAERAAWQGRYEECLLNEVLPLTLSLNADPRLITIGASFGGYHALSFGLHHPDLVTRILSLSGLGDIRRLTEGVTDAAVAACNPVEFMAQPFEPSRLALFQRMDILMAVGRDDALCWSNQELSRVLVGRQIGNALRIWDGWAHDWPWWKQMLALYIGGHD